MKATRQGIGSCLAIAAAFIIGIQSCLGQEASETQTKQDEREVLDILNRSPASALDVGLLGLRQTEIVTFLANKPQIFKQANFNYLEVSYSSAAHEIFVGVSYRSEAEKTDAVVDDCKDSVELATSPLVRSVSSEVANIVGTDDKHNLECKANTYFISQSIPRAQQLEITTPAWSVCDSIRVVVNVRHGDDTVTCRKDLTDKDIVVIRK